MSTVAWSGRRGGESAPSVDGKAVYAALAAARAEFGRAARVGSNSHLRNRYPTLASIVEACDEALGRHGLTFSQPIVQSASGPVLRTVLVHLESGERIESECPLLYDQTSKLNPMQALGSAITYARRYGLESLLGLMREDDDAEGAYPRHSGGFQAGRRDSTGPTSPCDSRPAASPVDRPSGPRSSRSGGSGASEGRPLQPFGVWLRAAAEQLGLTESQLVNQLHETAVRAGHAVESEPDQRKLALARRYNDPLKGKVWRDWLRTECKRVQAQNVSAPVAAAVLS